MTTTFAPPLHADEMPRSPHRPHTAPDVAHPHPERRKPHASLLPALPHRAVPAVEHLRLSRGTASVYPAELLPPDLLARTEIARQLCDHRYYDVVHRTLGHDFPLSFFVFHDRAGHFRGAQPFFVVDQNVLAGVQGKIAQFADRVRTRYPRFLTLKTLMLGNPAGPGALGIATHPVESSVTTHRHWFNNALGEALALYGRRHRVRISVFKDFPADHRPLMHGLTESPEFLRIPSMPMTSLPLAPYTSFDDYMSKALSKVTRKSMRRKLKHASGERIHLDVSSDISDCVDEVHRLYLQVYERAGLKFEKLTPHYFVELGRTMPDRARFFLWRRAGKLVAVSITLARLPGHPGHSPEESSLVDLYLGMEYPLALDLHLYFLTMRDIIQWCIDNRIATYYSTPLNYDAKLHFRHKLVPQDLYVRHTSSILNPPFKFAMRFAEPTRHDKIIHQFPNAHEL